MFTIESLKFLTKCSDPTCKETHNLILHCQYGNHELELTLCNERKSVILICLKCNVIVEEICIGFQIQGKN